MSKRGCCQGNLGVANLGSIGFGPAAGNVPQMRTAAAEFCQPAGAFTFDQSAQALRHESGPSVDARELFGPFQQVVIEVDGGSHE